MASELNRTEGQGNMTYKQAIEKATIMGYTGLVYRAKTDCLSAMIWLGDKQTRVAIYARGCWFLD